MNAPLHPCQLESGEFDHEWEMHDETFDHDYGAERVHYWRCATCGETKEIGPGDHDDDY
jgi:hypothetical protein